MSLTDSVTKPFSTNPIVAQGNWTSSHYLLFGTGLTALAAFFPLLYDNAIQVWLRPHYQFAPLAVLAAVLLTRERFKQGGPYQFGHPGIVAAGLFVVWLILGFAILMESPRVAAANFILFITVVGYALGGRHGVVDFLPGLALLAFTLPLPFLWDREILLALQRWTTRLSSKLLDSIGIFHVMSGNVLETGGRRLLVEEACSGINSFFVGFASALAFVFWRRRPWLHSLVMLLVVVPASVLVANIIRVTLVGYVGVQYGLDLSVGRKHTLLGILAFLGMLVLMVSADQTLRFLFEPIPKSPPVVRAKSRSHPPVRRFRTELALAAALLFAPLVLIQARSFVPNTGEPLSEDPTPRFARLTEESLPVFLGEWKRDAFEEGARNPGSNFGEHSRTWGYAIGTAQASVSLDYPFPGYHDLTICYTSQGWRILSQRQWPEDKDRFLEVFLEKPGYRSGYLLFRQFDRTGAFLEPHKGGPAAAIDQKVEIFSRVLSRLRGDAVASAREVVNPPVFQFQVFIESFHPLTEGERAKALQLFRESFEAIQPRAARP